MPLIIVIVLPYKLVIKVLYRTTLGIIRYDNYSVGVNESCTRKVICVACKYCVRFINTLLKVIRVVRAVRINEIENSKDVNARIDVYGRPESDEICMKTRVVQRFAVPSTECIADEIQQLY